MPFITIARALAFMRQAKREPLSISDEAASRMAARVSRWHVRWFMKLGLISELFVGADIIVSCGVGALVGISWVFSLGEPAMLSHAGSVVSFALAYLAVQLSVAALKEAREEAGLLSEAGGSECERALELTTACPEAEAVRSACLAAGKPLRVLHLSAMRRAYWDQEMQKAQAASAEAERTAAEKRAAACKQLHGLTEAGPAA